MLDSKTSCGLGKWRPSWLQKCARKEIYVIVYSVIGIIQGMGFNYLSTVLSTIEKQFGIKSEETAWVFSGNEISQILFIFALPFLGLIKKRPLWTSVSMIMTACGLLICTIPFFTKDSSQYAGGWNLGNSGAKFCGQNVTETCSSRHAVRDVGGMTTIFIGIFISGIGSSFFHSFGIPYMDDNMSKNKSPAYLGLVYGSRTLGPALGAVLGNFCLKVYVAPGLEGGLTEGEDGWLGAWWLGFIIVGAATLIIAPLLAFFPQRLPDSKEKTDAEALEENTPSDLTGKEFLLNSKECVGRLVKNKVYMLNLISAVTALFGFSGLGTFFPKYIEYHFRQKASDSGLTSLYSSAGTGAGIFLGGFLITKYKFRAKTLAGWSMFIGFVAVAALTALGFISCPRLEVRAGCKASDCGCSEFKFLPTCSADGQQLFFSACFAGCREERKEEVDGRQLTVFSQCHCAGDLAQSGPVSPWWLPAQTQPLEQHRLEAVQDFCPSSCDTMFYVTMAFISSVSFLGSTARVGGSIINLRVVQPEDKSASLIILISALSLFSLFPSPIVFGALLDKTCDKWGESCGELTNCQLYNTDLMRQYISWFPAACMAVSFLADIGVWWCVGDLELYQEEGESQDETGDQHQHQMKSLEIEKK